MDPVMMELGGAQYAVPADLAAEIAKMLESKRTVADHGRRQGSAAASAALEAAKADNAALRAKLDGLTQRCRCQGHARKLILEIPRGHGGERSGKAPGLRRV